MYAIKQAIIAKEHQPNLDIQVFMMDMRAFSKGYWEYYKRAQNKYGIRYIRCRVSSLHELGQDHRLSLKFIDEDNTRVVESFDLVVLSTGMEISQGVRGLAGRLNVDLDDYGFCVVEQPNSLESSRPGIFAAGPFREPKDIPESVVEASGAAAAAAKIIASARFTLTSNIEYPPERDVNEESLRIGVFVCHCGSNIAGFLDVEEVTKHASLLPHVAHAESNLYSCSQDSIHHISEVVKEQGLNRVVVASCSPLTHQPLFQDSLRAAGLNPYLFEMANIRNQCSWVHSHDNAAATRKAKELVQMAVARAALLAPRATIDVPVQNSALVVGGGPAGMTAALSLAGSGFLVHLVEREQELGGNLRYIFTALFNRQPQQLLENLINQVRSEYNIELYLDSQVIRTSGFVGNFTSQIAKKDEEPLEISHGVTILATGAQEYRGPEYGYGGDARILTQLDFEDLLAGDAASKDQLPDSLVMIQCVGLAEQYCSRICCTVALKNALKLKELKPEAEIIILYKDIRTYGFKERTYTRARQEGILFVRYEDGRPPIVTFDKDDELSIQTWDPVLGIQLALKADLLVLSMPVVPNQDVNQLSSLFKVPIDNHGFFQEAHVKLRPVDFTTEGVFMAGMAHYPKLLDESIIQAQAAASRAARVLSQGNLTVGARVAVVDDALCTGCLTCVRICPFQVPLIKSNLTGVGKIIGAAYIEPAACQGCGSCAAECPAQAIQLMHYTDAQMEAKVSALFHPADSGFVPISEIE
jgi:heterodisulfide reductase subunit A